MYIRAGDVNPAAPSSTPTPAGAGTAAGVGGFSNGHIHNGVLETRVFLHPSSFNFAEVSYPCPWMVYFENVHTSKVENESESERGRKCGLLLPANQRVSGARALWSRL
jgi:hypothetical protein